MATLIGKLEDCNNGVLRGWVWDPTSPDRIIEPIIVVDDVEVGSVRSDIPRRDLTAAGIGDGRHGFEAIIPSRLRDGQTHRVLLRFPTDDVLPDGHARVFSFPSTPQTIAGRVEGVRNGILVGWVWDRANPEAEIEVEFLARGEHVGSSTANIFRADLERAGIGDGNHAFRFQLSPAILDGDDELTLIVRAAREFGGQVLGTAKANDYSESKFKSARPAPAKVSTDKGGDNRSAPGKAGPVKPAPGPQPPDAKAGLATAKPVEVKEPGNVKELIAAATQAEAKGELDGADRLLRRAFEIAPKDFDVLFRFARVTLSRGDLVHAKDLALAALVARPNHVKPSIVMARISELEGDRLLALEYWKNVPPSDSAYFERLQKSARMLSALERPAEAIVLLEEAAKLRPNDMKLRETLAQLLQDLGANRHALAAWNAILAADPSHKRAPGKIAAMTRPARHPGFVQLPRRYRGIMTHAERPFAVATGNDADAILVGCTLGVHLAAHFETPAFVVAPSETPYLQFARKLLPPDIRLLAADAFDHPAELVFLLPEFITSGTDAAVPRGNATLSYAETGGGPKPVIGERSRAYIGWIEERLSFYAGTPPIVRIAADRGPQLLIVDGGPQPPDLDRVVTDKATKAGAAIGRFRLPIAGLDTCVPAYAEALGPAGAVVTSDSVCAHTAALAGCPAILVAPNAEALAGFTSAVHAINSATVDPTHLADAVRSVLDRVLSARPAKTGTSGRRIIQPAR